mmetsp:Transcript_63132/g.104969  ORF Transcript_63132/g.104969 Transcript_63132/m.104969 type:complete len:147 (+) Transcript_63132:281-721(+)|eukprot:CAMPEP_0119315530 /NCGR_PEP_ID=MMETSP1333-20130426/36226_1 /TAXON_ID=418940 /ORGANISM="Scyphosphaera apsteinii, Strain RCC1455" /LENGTH=146 /DNA_ID=CAMNT_0007320925 /DNA_START=271 /DNA_END=711 /DNA_ORIENTATION=+
MARDLLSDWRTDALRVFGDPLAAVTSIGPQEQRKALRGEAAGSAAPQQPSMPREEIVGGEGLSGSTSDTTGGTSGVKVKSSQSFFGQLTFRTRPALGSDCVGTCGECGRSLPLELLSESSASAMKRTALHISRTCGVLGTKYASTS